MGWDMLSFWMRATIAAVIFAGVANATIVVTGASDTHTRLEHEALWISREMIAQARGLTDRAFLDEHSASYLGDGRYRVSGLFWHDAPELGLEHYVVTLAQSPDGAWMVLEQKLTPMR